MCHRPASTCGNSSFLRQRSIRSFRCRPVRELYVVPYSSPKEGAQLHECCPLKEVVLPREFFRVPPRLGAVTLETVPGFPRTLISQGESRGGQECGAYTHRLRRPSDFRRTAEWNLRFPVQCYSMLVARS